MPHKSPLSEPNSGKGDLFSWRNEQPIPFCLLNATTEAQFHRQKQKNSLFLYINYKNSCKTKKIVLYLH